MGLAPERQGPAGNINDDYNPTRSALSSHIAVGSISGKLPSARIPASDAQQQWNGLRKHHNL
jgi:hypothetical protein